jgi:hypothetical protein
MARGREGWREVRAGEREGRGRRQRTAALRRNLDFSARPSFCSLVMMALPRVISADETRNFSCSEHGRWGEGGGVRVCLHQVGCPFPVGCLLGQMRVMARHT